MTIFKIRRPWPVLLRARASSAAVAAEPDGLDAFGSEAPTSSARGAATAPRNYRLLAVWILVAVAGIAAARVTIWAYQWRTAGASAQVTLSQLTIETTPAGLPIAVSGESKGRSPVTLDLAPGTYDVRIGDGPQQRVIHSTVVAGRALVERVEIAPANITGSLRVETEPAGLPVRIDGVDKGRSPLTIAQLQPGEYQIVAGTGAQAKRRVTVRANETVSVIISAAADRAAPSSGWLTVTSRLPLQLRENGKMIGSTDMEQVMLAAGDHTLELVNEAFDFRAQRRISIGAGKTAHLAIEMPLGTLSINAQPWAEVWLDGERIGETPIGNVSTPIGSHDLIFRHPELGERRATVAVGVKAPARVGVDMRKK